MPWWETPDRVLERGLRREDLGSGFKEINHEDAGLAGEPVTARISTLHEETQ